MSIIEQIKEEALIDHKYVVELRRYFHQHPELSKQEFNTASKIEAELDKLNIPHKRVGETGVYAKIVGKHLGKTILLRADIDALPIDEKHECEYKSQNKGVMHACGHDAHAASLIGACRILVKHLDDIYGTIILNFQQAEEIGYGARKFIDAGLVKGVDRTFGIHVASNVESGKVAIVPGENNASVDWFSISIKGKATHVSTPQLGVDALYVASSIVVNIQSIISRLNSPIDSVLIGIGKLTSGSAYNIVADSAKLEGTIRCLNNDVRKKTKQKLEEIAKSIASSYGASASFLWADFTSPLVNDIKSTHEVWEVANEIVGENNIIKSRKPSLGGDDMAEYILVSPGCYAFVGTGNCNKPNTQIAHHNEYFDIDEDALTTSVSLYAAYAIDYLEKHKNI